MRPFSFTLSRQFNAHFQRVQVGMEWPVVVPDAFGSPLAVAGNTASSRKLLSNLGKENAVSRWIRI